MAICYYMKCCGSFKSTSPEQTMMCTHTAGQRTMGIAMMRAHTAGHWRYLSPHLYSQYNILWQIWVVACHQNSLRTTIVRCFHFPNFLSSCSLHELTIYNPERTVTVKGTVDQCCSAESLITAKLRTAYEQYMQTLQPQQHNLFPGLNHMALFSGGPEMGGPPPNFNGHRVSSNFYEVPIWGPSRFYVTCLLRDGGATHMALFSGGPKMGGPPPNFNGHRVSNHFFRVPTTCPSKFMWLVCLKGGGGVATHMTLFSGGPKMGGPPPNFNGHRVSSDFFRVPTTCHGRFMWLVCWVGVGVGVLPTWHYSQGDLIWEDHHQTSMDTEWVTTSSECPQGAKVGLCGLFVAGWGATHMALFSGDPKWEDPPQTSVDTR